MIAASFIAHTEANTGSELPRFIKDEFDACRSRRRPTPGWSRPASVAVGCVISVWANSTWPAAIATTPMPADAGAKARSRRRTPPATRSTGCSGRA